MSRVGVTVPGRVMLVGAGFLTVVAVALAAIVTLGAGSSAARPPMKRAVVRHRAAVRHRADVRHRPVQAQSGPTLTVDATGPGGHAIDPDIYGLNFASTSLGKQISLPVDRWGGNTTDTYNWKIGADNTASDYYFENVADCWNTTYNWCSGDTTNPVRAYQNEIAGDRTMGATTLLTLPMVGYVARDAPVAQPLTCGFPTSVYPQQDSFDPYDSSCGNGKKNGQQLTGQPKLDGTAVGAAWNKAWVQSLVSRYGDAAAGGVGFYELGNEPSLWSDTHADVHPAPETASELWSKSRALAVAVKQADPTAQVLGFSEWGWNGYFCTGKDTPGNGCGPTGCTTSPDCAAHGHLPMAEWYLQKFARYDAVSHARHLDYLDVHYYAQGGNSTDVTRSLWDPSYTDPSWINYPIALIPRMQCWVNGHVAGLCPSSAGYYPGTKLAISEYNLSLPNVSAQTNAIIQGDTLGIFAREGVSLATRWGSGDDGSEINDAFLMYRNYDGAGSKFGGSYIESTSADQSAIAVYAAKRSSDGAYTVMVINKTNGPLTSPLALQGGISGTVAAWQWAGGPITQVSPAPQIQDGVIDAAYPALSMTLYAVSP